MHHPARRSLIIRALSLVALAAVPACRAPAVLSADPVPAERRAIVLSLDSFNEARLRASLPADAIPTILSLLDGGACAASARPAFPSVTAAGHASLWTGAYGNVNGITANWLPRLPRDEHTLLDGTSGFFPEQLRAEPMWITATLRGVSSVGHHTTQSPGSPGYLAERSARGDASLRILRARADSAMGSPLLHLVNGYDSSLANARVITEATAPLRTVRQWPHTPAAMQDGTVELREAVLPLGRDGDSLFVLLAGTRGRYDRVIVSGARDPRRAVVVRAAPVEAARPAGRPLARHFSAPLALTIGGRAARTHVRLFELAPDGSRFRLFLPAIAVIAANHDSTRAGYEAAAQWVGNSASSLLGRGEFGPTLRDGGDGTAERRWLETAELMTRESIAGARWMYAAHQPRLFLDYFALGDDTDHTFWGFVSPDAPGYDPAVARTTQAIRAHAWALVDARVRAVQELARSSGAALFLSGDHGMRATWRSFRPNVLLAQAGLLSLDSASRIDLSKSRALAPNGYWISVNRAAWREGIVPPSEEHDVIARVVDVLRGARGPDGAPIVTRIYLATDHDSLGLGGPNGGDVYFELAPGYAYSGGTTGEVVSAAAAHGAHGFASVSPDMHTVLCATGAGFPARRLPEARTIDLAPTVLEWIGVPTAPTVRGRSLLGAMRR